MNGHWKYPTSLDPKNNAGFVYIIRDLFLDELYIGKKHFKVKRGQFKGDESDWRYYKSSSKLLKYNVDKRPIEEFEFIVLDQYRTLGGLSWAETWSMVMAEVPLNRRFYNTRVEGVSWKVTEPVTQLHKNRLSKILAGGRL